jgi:hypothetical protein
MRYAGVLSRLLVAALPEAGGDALFGSGFRFIVIGGLIVSSGR